MSETALPRGVRNNNPGNLSRNNIVWQGLAADQSSDPRFYVFVSPQYGIRALAMVLLSYQDSHDLNTIREIINRWAPPVENNTDAYVNSVSSKTGISPDTVIDVHDLGVARLLVDAIIAQECANYIYPVTVINEALALAGITT